MNDPERTDELLIRFEGLDADTDRVNIGHLGESLIGMDRLLNLGFHVLGNGHVPASRTQGAAQICGSCRSAPVGEVCDPVVHLAAANGDDRVGAVNGPAAAAFSESINVGEGNCGGGWSQAA